MLLRCSEIIGTNIRAVDGDIGDIRDLYFDDSQWATRYFVADTGNWLTSRLVLLSPAALQHLDRGNGVAHFGLTRQQIEESPDIDRDQPVSRQHELAVVGYYNWPAYWSTPVPSSPIVRRTNEGDPHLRSARTVMGYYLRASDGDLGHVDDFLVEDEAWHLGYLIVDTRNWWPGRKVAIATELVRTVDWAHSKVDVEPTREEVRNSPEYDASRPLTPDFEYRLTAYYGHHALRV